MAGDAHLPKERAHRPPLFVSLTLFRDPITMKTLNTSPSIATLEDTAPTQRVLPEHMLPSNDLGQAFVP
jgi:hypothetical protein